MITVRRASSFDAGSMAALLNAIIEKGGTTAILRPMTADDIRSRMAFAVDQSAWNVAVDETEKVLGFQWIAPSDYLPPEACDIASFVELGRTGLGIGSSLFDATEQAAKELGYVWINANIRSDNESGLTYYQSRGFRDWKYDIGVELTDGMIVDKTHKRYDI
jgi:GNAT superfamily N-acetyltransferase